MSGAAESEHGSPSLAKLARLRDSLVDSLIIIMIIMRLWVEGREAGDKGEKGPS